MDRIALLKQYLAEDPADPFTRFALASEYVKAGETTEGLELFESLVVDRPDYVGTYYHLAALYRRLERTDDARTVYEAGIREAAKQGDRHSESELRGALMEMEIEED